MEKDVLESYLKAGAAAKGALSIARKYIKEGASAMEAADEIEAFIRADGCAPAFPVNMSIDADAAHYTPAPGDDVVFKAGQVVKVDVGVHKDGYIADTAISIEISTSSWKRLIEASAMAVERALALIRAGTPISALSEVIERTIRSAGYRPIENLTGHYLGRFIIHAGGNIPNVKAAATGVLREGDVIAIEPFATPGAGAVEGTRAGNIYRLLEARNNLGPDLRKTYDGLKARFSTLPLTSRWIPEVPQRTLLELVRKQAMMRYPVLTDEKRGMVSQAEHSAIVTKNGAIVYTRD